MDFQEAERKYAELKQLRDSQQIPEGEFISRVHELRLQDHIGGWWQIRPQDGGWLRWNGSSWEWGSPEKTEKPYSPVLADSSGQGITGSVDKFRAMDADKKRKVVVVIIIGCILLYAAFMYLQAGIGKSNPFNFGSGTGGSIGGMPSFDLGLGGSPETVVKDYLNSIDRGDYAGAADMMVDSSNQPLSSSYKSQFITLMTSVYGTNGENIEFSDIQTTSQKVTDNEYVVTVTATMSFTNPASGATPQKSKTSNSVYVIKVNGAWKLMASSLGYSGYLSPTQTYSSYYRY